jgi:CBS domain containing-hemolysin-like protein/mannitol/fructose-specific phosphotransferase system IIA component
MAGEIGLAFVALLLVLLNGFFVLAEFAIVKVRATRLEQLAEGGAKDAKLALHVVSRLDDYLSATQLGITLASLGLGWLGEPAFARLFQRILEPSGWLSKAASHGAATIAAFAFITFLHILVGELAPKSIAIQYAEKSAIFSARPLTWFYRVFGIPLALMNGACRALLRLLRIRPASEAELTYTEEELRSILGASQELGGFSFHHLLLLENAFDFGELRLRDVMVPLEQVTCLDATKPWPENAAVIAQKRLSRYPLREGPKGRMIGLVHVKTILIDLLMGRTPDLRRDALKIPRALQETLLEAALRRLQKSGEHMGIVVDEKGSEIGMFTLEDIVEELIGDVRDEFEPSREVSIADLVRPDTILLDPPVLTRRELLDTLVRHAYRALPGDPGPAIQAVLRREKAVPSSVGGSVAVPHARVPGLKAPVGAFARLKEGIEWHAPDGRPSRLAFLFLSPDDASPGTQARLLRRTAGLLDSDYLRGRLLEASSPEEVQEILRIGETSASV